jgi:hypothetical protein
MMISQAQARSAYEAGLSVVPPAQDGTKRPWPPGGGGWKDYQTRRAPLALVTRWYDPNNGLTGIGVVCGRVSGGLECLDFDTLDGWQSFLDLANACGMKPLIDRIWSGYGELTPRGAHLLYRCSEIAGNSKIAKDASGKAFLESRGEGGYVIIAPSHGTVHPSGGAYRCVSGALYSIVTLSTQERRDLWDFARCMDCSPKTPDAPDPIRSSSDPTNRPGEEFNKRASWGEVLEPHGWTRVFTRGESTYWRRPGKNEGVSATTGYAGTDYLYVFSTSTGLDSERAYTKFSVFALLNHSGDFRAATSALAKAGYGEPPVKTKTALTSPTPFSPLQIVPASPQPAPKSPRVPLILMADYIARPRPMSYLIKGILPAMGLAQIFGDSNVGKSFIAIDMGCHIACGLPWRGMRVKQTGVVYIAAEGLGGLAARLAAWSARMEVVPDRFWIREWPVGLTVPGAAAVVAEDIAALPNPVGLIILDTFAGNFGVGSENDAADMAAALLGMKALGHQRMSLNVHHTGHQDKGRSRGHSSLYAAIDVELMASRKGDSDVVMLSHTKVREGERMTPLGFRLERVDLPWADEDGEPINSAVAVPADAPENSFCDQGPSLSRKQADALEVLRRMIEERQANVGPTGVPRVSMGEWGTAMIPMDPHSGNRKRTRDELVAKHFVRLENGFVYLK